MAVASIATCSAANQSSESIGVHEIDPTADSRWTGFLDGHKHASVFHTASWLEALRRTYAYTPTGFTTSPPNAPLTNAIPFCRISSFLGKRRLVSLPFSDHCEPLVQCSEQLAQLTSHLERTRQAQGLEYIEVRPLIPRSSAVLNLEKIQTFYYHKLDLKPDIKTLFAALHKSCVQRKIVRAEKEGLRYEKGVSERLLQQFYELLVITRRRQGMPIQPVEWFRNLISCFGNNLCVRVASRYQRPIASILTLRYKSTLVYKYGCSDHAFSRFGGMQLLLWRAIEEAKQEQADEFDLGRSDTDNDGLIAFKSRWGAATSEIGYFRCGSDHSIRASKAHRSALSRYIWSHAPGGVLTAAGRLLYRHFG